MMGKAKYFLGDIGQGTKAKLVVNVTMGTMLGALAEGLELTQVPCLCLGKQDMFHFRHHRDICKICKFKILICNANRKRSILML